MTRNALQERLFTLEADCRKFTEKWNNQFSHIFDSKKLLDLGEILNLVRDKNKNSCHSSISNVRITFRRKFSR